ncbi:MAG: SPOR domain-containing protein [Oligoflexales bacterium]|nr:SPOR domain-containing protein [Oligoflexales bacterium]
METKAFLRAFAIFFSLGSVFMVGRLIYEQTYKSTHEDKKVKFAGDKNIDEVPQRQLFYSTIGHDSTESIAEVPISPPNNQFTIEIATFVKLADAEKLVASLSKQGISAYYSPYNTGGHVIYKVRSGHFQNLDSAESATHALIKNGLSNIKTRRL